jgi:epoxyqueuosine reductase
MGRQVFGCDICQDVCPWNRHAPIAKTSEFEARPTLVNPDLEWLAKLSLDEFRTLFRGTPVKRAKHKGLLRNIAIAMGNSGEQRFLPVLRELAGHEDSVIAESARWALHRLERPDDRRSESRPIRR